jgi:hypothetical protein
MGFFVGKPERKRPLGRPRRGWEDNIKIYLQEVNEWREIVSFRAREMFL